MERSVGRHVVHLAHGVEFRLLGVVGHAREHRAVLEVMAVHDGDAVGQRAGAAVIHEHRTSEVVLAQEGVLKVPVVVGMLGNWVVHRRVGNLHPAHDLRVLRGQGGEVNRGRAAHLVLLHSLLHKRGVFLIAHLVLGLRVHVHAGSDADGHEAHHKEENREHEHALRALLLARGLGRLR